MGAGGGCAEQAAGVAAKARGAIHRHQGVGPLGLALGQQGFDGGAGGAALADPEQGVDPQGFAAGLRRLLQPGDPKPEAVAQMALAEWLIALKRAPDRHLDPGQVQLPGDYQPIAAVVARPH